LCHVPHTHVHVTTAFPERTETHVQRFFPGPGRRRRLVDPRGWVRGGADDRGFVGVGSGRFDDRDQVAGNVNVLTLAIQDLRRQTDTDTWRHIETQNDTDTWRHTETQTDTDNGDIQTSICVIRQASCFY